MDLSAAQLLENRKKQYQELFPVFLPQIIPEKNIPSKSTNPEKVIPSKSVIPEKVIPSKSVIPEKVLSSESINSEKDLPLKSSSVNSPNPKRKATSRKEFEPEVITIPESPPSSPILISIPESPEKSGASCSDAKRPKLSSAEKENKSGFVLIQFPFLILKLENN